jgi:hypothetical protein
VFGLFENRYQARREGFTRLEVLSVTDQGVEMLVEGRSLEEFLEAGIRASVAPERRPPGNKRQ